MAWEEYDGRNVSHGGVEALRSTDKAVLVLIEDEEYWIPQSQIDDDSEVYREGQSGTLVISKWLARQKGWWDD